MKGSKKLITIIVSVIVVFAVMILVIMVMKNARATELSPHAEDDGKEMISSLKAESKAAESKAESKTESKATSSVAKADSTDAPEETILEDPYGMYVVTEDWLKKYGGYAVERNGKLYAFYSQHGVMGDVPEKYGVGYEVGTREYEKAFLYLLDPNEKNDVATSISGRIITSSGDFPIFKVSKNEEIRVYSNDTLDKIRFSSANFYGYTINASHIGDSYRPVVNYVAGYDQTLTNGENVSICDMNDQPVADIYNLEQGKKYKYVWYKGTEYHEMIVVADSRCYSRDEKAIYVPTKPTKNGYFVTNLSDLALGTYYSLYSVFEVTD